MAECMGPVRFVAKVWWKRSSFPLTALLVLLAALGLGHLVLQVMEENPSLGNFLKSHWWYGLVGPAIFFGGMWFGFKAGMRYQRYLILYARGEQKRKEEAEWRRTATKDQQKS